MRAWIKRKANENNDKGDDYVRRMTKVRGREQKKRYNLKGRRKMERKKRTGRREEKKREEK